MRLKKFHTIIQNTPEEVKEDIRFSMDILDRIHELLNEKFDGKQKLLAEKMGKSEAEVSKWLSGVQNFTIKTINKLQIAFEAPILAVCTTNAKEATYTQTKIPYKCGHATMSVSTKGIEENLTSFEDVKKYGIKKIIKQKFEDLPA